MTASGFAGDYKAWSDERDSDGCQFPPTVSGATSRPCSLFNFALPCKNEEIEGKEGKTAKERAKTERKQEENHICRKAVLSRQIKKRKLGLKSANGLPCGLQSRLVSGL